MLEMLRFLLLKDQFDALEDHLKMQLCTMRPIEECLEAVEIANSLNFHAGR